MTEYKKYDSDDTYAICGVRLAKDAEVRQGNGDAPMVRLTFVSTSRTESDSDLWVEANIADRQADLASFLKKGDTLHKIEGKPTIRKYGSPEKVSFGLRRASLVVPLEMFKTLKERGFTPGAKGAPPAKGAAKPAGRKSPPPAEMPDLDDDIPF